MGFFQANSYLFVEVLNQFLLLGLNAIVEDRLFLLLDLFVGVFIQRVIVSLLQKVNLGMSCSTTLSGWSSLLCHSRQDASLRVLKLNHPVGHNPVSIGHVHVFVRGLLVNFAVLTCFELLFKVIWIDLIQLIECLADV